MASAKKTGRSVNKFNRQESALLGRCDRSRRGNLSLRGQKYNELKSCLENSPLSSDNIVSQVISVELRKGLDALSVQKMNSLLQRLFSEEREEFLDEQAIVEDVVNG